MKAVRFILEGNTIMIYHSKPRDKKYGIVFAGTKKGNYPKILKTSNFEDTVMDWLNENKDNDAIESIEVF